MRKYWERFLELCKSRIFVVLVGIFILFSILVHSFVHIADFKR